MRYAYKKLKGRITEVFGSQKELSRVLGISENSVSKKLTGKTEFSQSDVEQWSELLEIRKNEYGEFFFT